MGPAFNFSQIMEKVGVSSLTLTQGKDKDMLNPYRPWKAGEDQSLRVILENLYDRFVTIVTEARPRIERDRLLNEYGAQVFNGKEAETFGYVDVPNADYSTALQELATAAGIEANTTYQVVKLATPHSWISELSSCKTDLLQGRLTHVFQIGNHINSELCGKFLYLYPPVL